MRRWVATAFLIGLVAAGCTRAATPDVRGSTAPASGSASPSLAPSPTPSPSPESDIRFLLDDTYAAGDRVVVRIENVGDVPYYYQAFYQACFLAYFDPQGDRFIIPPGTHCDMLVEVPIRPGETKRLFVWDLDECVKDNWGCARSRPLDPGRYTVRGTFQPVHQGPNARAEVTFEIQPAQ